MRKRIWRMSEDKFDNQIPQLILPADTLEFVGDEGKKLQEELRFSCSEGSHIRGMVYSSNPYVRILKPQFDGTDITVPFEIRGQHYVEGDHLRGYFTIVYNGGEHRLPFDVQFKAEKLMSSVGEIASLKDFAELAKGHWSEAMKLFYSDAFAKFIRKFGVQERLLYAGYRRAIPSSANFEEFLVSAGLKEAVTFSVKEGQRNFYRLTENRKETFMISKSNWGYIEIDIDSDNDFVTVEKEHITSDFFLGSTMILNYYVHKNRMHAGKNYARITFSCKGTIYEITIMATFDREDEEYQWNYRQQNREKVLLTQTYEQYRLQRITTGEWCEKSIAILDDMLRMEPENCWYTLMKAQCYIVNRQRQEALWIIQDMKRDIKDKSGAQWAYLLYLCTLIEQEESYVDRLTKEIELIFRQHPEDVRIFWFLSFLKKEYVGDNSRRLKAMKQWIGAGHPSPFLLIEAYNILLIDPYMIHDFSEATLSILYWAARRDLLTGEMSLQIAHIVEKCNVFSNKIWFLIQEAYKVNPSDEFLSIIISYLLRNQRYQEEYLSWYRKGIERDLRIGGLYEGFMLTMPDSSTEELPQMVVRYFQYSCSLPDQKRALLYANVIVNRKKAPQVFEQYFRNIELFAIEQMKLNRMNDNLAIIYQCVLEMGIVDEDIANSLAAMVFMKKLVCIYPDIMRAIVYQEQYEMPIVVPVVEGVAFVPIVSRHFQVFLETKNGTLITNKGGYRLQNIMFPDAYMGKLKTLAPLSLTFILSDFEKKTRGDMFEIEDVNRIDTFLHSSLVSKEYIRSKYEALISFLKLHCREELLEDHFIHEVDYDTLDKNTLTFIFNLFLEKERYELVYSLLKKYDGLDVDVQLLLRMCNELIVNGNFEVDEFLLDLCAYLAEEGLATPATVVYLSGNRVGPTKWMLKLWMLAQEQEVHALDLEENILFQALYAESCMEDVMPIFESYMYRGKDKMLIEAYLNFWSHEYMLAKREVPQQFFTYLAYYFDRGANLKESCKLAYMKFLSGIHLLSDREFKILDKLLQYYVLRNIYFGFYRDMDERLIVKYHLYDKRFVEYRGTPGERITITYRFDDKEEVMEDMVEMYEGIFVKQFLIFFGETLSYELYNEESEEKPVLSDKISISSQLQEKEYGRYDMLNRMQNELIYSERGNLSRDMKSYQGLDQVTKTLFTTV